MIARSVRLVVASFLVALLGSATLAPPSLAQQGTIDFLVWGNAESNAVEEMVIAAFEAKHPEINVELQNPGGNHMDRLLTSIAAGVPPDIAIVDFYDLPAMIEAGLAADITEWAERDGVIEQLRRELHPAALREMQYNGRLYSVANVRIGVDGLYYNKDIFDAAALAYPDDSWTIETMRESAIRLVRRTDDAVSQWGIEFHRFFIWPFIRMNGGRLLSEDGTYSPFDEPAAYDALQWLADLDLVHEAIAWNPYERPNAFAQGLAGMHIMWVGGLIQQLRSSVTWEWDIAPIPAGRLGSIGTVKGNPVVIPVNADDKELAWEFMKFLGSEEAYTIYGVQGRFVPMHRGAVARVIEDSQGLPPANLRAALEWRAEPLPDVPGFRQVQDMWHVELEPVWRGQTSARAAGERIRELSVGILADARRR